MNASYRYNLTHCYLEVTRGSMMQVHAKVPSDRADDEVEISNDIVSAVFALTSITIIYSYLSLESFTNYRLFHLWQQRRANTEFSKRLLRELGESGSFEEPCENSKVHELHKRIRVVCRVLGYKEPHIAIPATWRRFNELAKDSRHFLVHPHPDADFFQGRMKLIIMETKTGEYVRVVEELLTFMYQQGGKSVPEWLSKNTLLAFRGAELIPPQG